MNPHAYSPLHEKYPNADVDIPIARTTVSRGAVALPRARHPAL